MRLGSDRKIRLKAKYNLTELQKTTLKSLYLQNEKNSNYFKRICVNRKQLWKQKIPFDYSTLSTKWTELSKVDNEFVICEYSDVLIIEGNKLTCLYIAAGERWRLEILNSYQTGNTIVLNVNTIGQEDKTDFKIILDEDKGIAEWIFGTSHSGTFVSNEKLSAIPKAKCFYEYDDEEETVKLIKQQKINSQ